MAKVDNKYEGIEAFGFKLSVYEMKKNYEVHFMFDHVDMIMFHDY